MFRLLAVASCLAVVLGFPSNGIPKPNDRIVGGEPADIEDYPYQISLQIYGIHICGGSIISRKYILTSAHCTYGSSASSLSIRAGSSIREEGGQVIGVKAIYQNPEFNVSTNDYDVSVLELENEILFNESAQPITLAAKEPSSGSDAICTGWGTTSASRVFPKQLQKVTVQTIPRSLCRDHYAVNKISKRMICAGASGKDSCQGDAGGPLVVDGVLVGIVSWGYGCADPFYLGVYSNVAALRDFIETNLQ